VTLFGRAGAILRPSLFGYWLLVTLLGLPLITPLLRWVSGPCTNDGHLLYHRLAALRYAWESGLRFSRWLPDLSFGYGYPFLLYREAPPLYLGLAPHLLGLPLPASINLFYALCILAAGWFMFLWVRDVFGSWSGVVSALAYMSAPYVLIDSLVLGIQPEAFALALLPLLGWAGRRFIVGGTVAAFLAATLALALLTMSHNISTLLFVPFLLVYLLVVGWLERLEWRPMALRLLLLFGLGLGLGSFYTAPALLELDEINIDRAVSNRNNDFHFNFVTVDEILAPVLPADPTLLNPPFLVRLGWVPVALAILGIASIFWLRQRERRGHVLFMALAAGALLFMSFAASLALWENLPLIEFVQFPWRLIGRAALPLAFLAGAPFALLTSPANPLSGRGLYKPLLLAGALLLLLVEALPMLTPHSCPAEAYPSINNVHQYERRSGLVGVDPVGSFFPISVQERPAGSPLEVDYVSGRIPQRFDATVLPEGADVERAEYGPTAATIELNSPISFQARYLSFAFPGWTATVDGQQTPISPSAPEGLITFPVPAGRHLVEVRWGTTPIRNAAALVSFLALAALVGVSVVLARRQRREGNGQAVAAVESTGKQMALPGALAILLVIAVLFLLFKLLVVDQQATPFRREAPPPVALPGDLSAAELHFEGHSLSQESVAAGDIFEIDLALRAIETPGLDYQSNVWLRGPDGQIWSDKETTRPRTYEETSPTSFWLPGHWAWDSREVRVLPGTPPGQYDIVLTLFNLADLRPLTIAGSGGEVVGPAAVIGKIEVTRPGFPPEFDPQFPMSRNVSGLSLLGFSQDRQAAAPGELMLLTLFWEKTDSPDTPADRLKLELIDEAGNVAQSWLLPPARVDYPPIEWQEGERVRGQHSLRLAAGLGDGLHRFLLEGAPLGDLTVNAPQRLFERPEFATAIEAIFEEEAELVGYSIDLPIPDPQAVADDSGPAMTVVLVWQGLAEMPVGYRAFVHLVDEEGQIIAQSDAEPAGWSRPTTGWAVGEYVIDEHLLMLPEDGAAGELLLRAGLYDAATGRRLLSDGSDHALLPLGNEIINTR
jgi:hypothetical protein